MKKSSALVIVLVVAVGLAYYLWGTPSSEQKPTQAKQEQTTQNLSSAVTHTITIKNFSFDQKSITVKKGDTVVWTNNDSASHTVTGDNSGPSSSTVNTGGTYSFTFNDIGTFGYHCSFHPSMKATVVVTQ